VVGLYSSRLVIGWLAVSVPAVTRTLPVGCSVAVWSCRAVRSDPVGVQVPVSGFQVSALASRVRQY